MNKILLICFILAANISFAIANDNAPSKPTQQTELTAVNINQADVKTLSTLKGIGKKKAQAIIKHREMHGEFHSVKGLLEVDGVGKKVLKENSAVLKI